LALTPNTGTEDLRREDYDLYIGQLGAETLFAVKMHWMGAFTRNIFIEEKTLRNTKAQKMAIGLLYVHTFDVDQRRDSYGAAPGRFLGIEELLQDHRAFPIPYH
jgi:hypothetical protein